MIKLKDWYKIAVKVENERVDGGINSFISSWIFYKVLGLSQDNMNNKDDKLVKGYI